MTQRGDDGHQGYVERLARDVADWRQDGVITPEQAQTILARYPALVPGYAASRRRQSLVVALSVLGAVLVGLGVITFFAANWDEIPRGVKLGSLLLGMALSYGAGYIHWRRSGGSAVAVALVLLGCILYGAGIHLIGQTYHIAVDHPNLTLAWFLGIAPLAYITRSRPVMLLTIIVFLAAMGFRLPDLLAESGTAEDILGVVYFLAMAALLYAIGRVKGLLPGWEAHGGLFQSVGILLAFGVLYLLSFNSAHDRYREAEAVALGYQVIAYGVSAIAVGALAALAWHRAQRTGRWRTGAVEVALAAALLTAAHVAAAVSVEWTPAYPILFNALFSLSALALMASGYLHEHEWRVNVSLALIAVYLITRYFEYSTTLFDRSLVFVGAGVVLLVGGYLLERGRRQLLSAMQEREGEP